MLSHLDREWPPSWLGAQAYTLLASLQHKVHGYNDKIFFLFKLIGLSCTDGISIPKGD